MNLDDYAKAEARVAERRRVIDAYLAFASAFLERYCAEVRDVYADGKMEISISKELDLAIATNGSVGIWKKGANVNIPKLTGRYLPLKSVVIVYDRLPLAIEELLLSRGVEVVTAFRELQKTLAQAAQ